MRRRSATRSGRVRASATTEPPVPFTVSTSPPEVTLAQPTPNPRLNQILLNTLREWKFFPAMRDGIAINSEFDVRIPITVQ